MVAKIGKTVAGGFSISWQMTLIGTPFFHSRQILAFLAGLIGVAVVIYHYSQSGLEINGVVVTG